MLVKCKICNHKIDRDNSYKILLNGKNNYYCSEKEYNEWLSNKKIKDNTYSLIYDIFGRKVTHTILYKEVDELSNVYTYSKIFAYLKENYDYLCKVMSKEFAGEYAQIRYFTAILKNSLADFSYIEKDVIKKSVNMDFVNAKFTRKTKRKPLVEYEIGGDLD